jgi:hypothetical protein
LPARRISGVPDLAPELREFLTSKFSSMEQLDVFLLLYRSGDRRWSAKEVAQELRMAPQSAEMRLFLMTSAGLLAASDASPLVYWYERASALDILARALSDASETDRDAMTAALESPAAGATARLFADAFRLKKP